MDTRHLQYIVTIAQRQNMTKAAEELYVSQSSLSQYLGKLEKKLGVPLFERTKNKLLLTPAGERYVEAARKILDIEKETYADIRSLNNRIINLTRFLWKSDPCNCVRIDFQQLFKINCKII